MYTYKRNFDNNNFLANISKSKIERQHIKKRIVENLQILYIYIYKKKKTR